ncbi:protein phosphatase 2C domain-containing protein [Streptomyces sp. NBC_01619]|uniref:PP2C family protein-serine/threonine phosphatase n=1 Tax=Streptomyces sp. NBC_01619 TaxID=2975901 RepID=UPI0022540150|nr:protein phosphatase 2C domain-containing protein [Streptomyces sp. NBC_01619]MCX4515902.1 protein phosphatase 2C domain-containing protein [Streptomyces sp. NBC_01619]
MPSRWTMSTRTDQGPRHHMADAAHHAGRLAWAVADGVGDDYEPALAADMAVMAAPYAAVTGGAARGIAAARATLKDYYRGAPPSQVGDCVMVTAAPMPERVGGGWDFAWVGDCRAYVLQRGGLRQVTEDHTEGEAMRGWKDPYWATIAHAYDHIVTRTVLGDETIASARIVGPVERVMLCSDGVSKVVPAPDIERILTADIHPRHATRALIAAARSHRSGTDNIAVTVIAPRTP